MKYEKCEHNECDNPPPKRLRHSHISFDFLAQCIFCGDHCNLEKDLTNPERWRPAFLCRSTVSKHDRKPYKQYILEKCSDHDDDWGNEVRVRVEGAISDLHAAEARYHRDCMSRFFANRFPPQYLKKEACSIANDNQKDLALAQLIQHLSGDKAQIRNSLELFQMYQDYGGLKLNRSQLIVSLQSHFSDELLVLSSPGYANIVAFHSQTASVLKVVTHTIMELPAAMMKFGGSRDLQL